MTKKGQGLPLNTIIIAIIVLVVLVVLIAIFMGRIAIFSSDLDKVASLEGTKVRAQLIGQNCVPSDAGIAEVLKGADTSRNGRIDSTEDAKYSSDLQQLTNTCTSSNSQTSQGCRDNQGKCQWQVAESPVIA